MDSTLGVAELQSALLEVLADPKSDKRLARGRGDYGLTKGVRALFPDSVRIHEDRVMEAVWSIIGQGLAYIDYSQSAPELWNLRLTTAGRAAAGDTALNPDNPNKYLERLREKVPQASEIVLSYVNEAVSTYNARSYLASAVMLGVASEAAFLEVARSFGEWLPEAQGQKFLNTVENARASYNSKFEDFRKKIEPHKSELPDELSEGMSLTLDSILDALRISRNEAGHPTGKTITRDDAFIYLQMIARYLQKMYQLKEFFDSASSSTM